MNLKKGEHWQFQQYISFWNDLPSFEKEEFENALVELCKGGLIECVENFNPPHYCLTLKGEMYIYK